MTTSQTYQHGSYRELFSVICMNMYFVHETQLKVEDMRKAKRVVVARAVFMFATYVIESKCVCQYIASGCQSNWTLTRHVLVVHNEAASFIHKYLPL